LKDQTENLKILATFDAGVYEHEEHYRSVVCFRVFACALALGKAWNKYFFSSCAINAQNEIAEEFSGTALSILTYSCSTDYLKFEQYGAYVSRSSKIKVSSEEEAAVMEKKEKQVDAILRVIENQKDLIAAKVKEHGIV